MSVAKKTRVSGSREKSREIISGSSLYFFGQFIPTFAVADLRPHLPAERLGFLLDTRLQLLDATGYALLALPRQVVASEVVAEGAEVGCESAPQTPVGGAKPRDVCPVYRFPVLLPHPVVVQQREGVLDVLLVELHYLQFG